VLEVFFLSIEDIGQLMNELLLSFLFAVIMIMCLFGGILLFRKSDLMSI